MPGPLGLIVCRHNSIHVLSNGDKVCNDCSSIVEWNAEDVKRTKDAEARIQQLAQKLEDYRRDQVPV